MWLPTPVYERLPQFFFLLGLLFIANGLYLGLEFSIAFVYFGFGLWCSAYGAGIFVVRLVRRSNTENPGTMQDGASASADPLTE